MMQQKKAHKKKVIYLRPGEGKAIWVAGDTYTFKAVGEDTDGVFAFWEATVPPQAGPPSHIHHSGDEAYYLLEGELEIMADDRTFTAGAGSFVYIPKGTLHAFRNVSTTPSKMLLLITPAGFEKFFFEVGQPARPGATAPLLGTEEMERTIAAAPKYGMELKPLPKK